MSFFLVNFVYPCLIFDSIFNNFTINGLITRWELPAGSFMIMVIGFLIGFLVTCWLSFKEDDERKSFLYQCLMNNYSFLPLPLVILLFGDESAAMLIFSSLGAEVALWTLGVIILRTKGHKANILRNLLSPPLVAMYVTFILMIMLHLLGFDKHSFIQKMEYPLKAIKMIGAATIPLAMTVAGMRIAGLHPKGLGNMKVWIVSAMRLIIIPIVAVLVIKALPFPDASRHILIVVAVMPVAIASILMSEIYGGDKNFMSATVLTTHLLALVTVPVLLAVFL